MGFGYNVDPSKTKRPTTQTRNYNYKAKQEVDKIDGVKQGKSFKELLKNVLKKDKRQGYIMFEDDIKNNKKRWEK